jgi:hypothetical protein
MDDKRVIDERTLRLVAGPMEVSVIEPLGGPDDGGDVIVCYFPVAPNTTAPVEETGYVQDVLMYPDQAEALVGMLQSVLQGLRRST